MKIFNENRKKIILKNLLALLAISLIIILIINFIKPFHKSVFELVTIFTGGSIGLILSTRKIKLQFDDNIQILKIADTHILGGEKEYSINYDNLSFKKNKNNLLNFILNKPELIILKNNSIIAEIKNLDNVTDSNNLRELLKKFN